ncbi:hypothetical protein BKA93DRAFT_759607 [Sparassis latifolia]
MIIPNEKLAPYPSEDKKASEITDAQMKQNDGAGQPPPYEIHRDIQVARAIAPQPTMSAPHAFGGPVPAQTLTPRATGATASPSSPTPTVVVPALTQLYHPTSAQRVNHFSVFSRHNSVSGTYLVDPSLPASPQTTTLSGLSMRRIERCNRSADREHAKNTRRAFGSDSESDCSSSRGWKARTPEVNAAFRTRHGQISVDVAVVGPNLYSATDALGMVKNLRARVMFSSRHGNISVNLREVQPGHCVDLDVSTRHGNVVILLPPTFDGAIVVHTRGDRDQVRFLQAFAECARTVRAHDRSTQIVLSPNANTTGREGDDRCLVSTRHGKITFGLSGYDKADGVLLGGGLFKMLGDLMQMGKSWRSV